MTCRDRRHFSHERAARLGLPRSAVARRAAQPWAGLRATSRTAMPVDPGLERVPAPDVENAPSGWRVAGILRRRNGFRPEISTRGRSARRIRPLAGFAGARRHVARQNHARRGGDRSSRLAQPARPAAPGGPCCGTASLPSGEFRARSCSGVLLAMIASALI